MYIYIYIMYYKMVNMTVICTSIGLMLNHGSILHIDLIYNYVAI